MIELSNLNLSDLHTLQTRVSDEIAARKVTDKRAAMLEVRRTAQERGFSLDELFGKTEITASRRGGSRGPVAPRYAKPGEPDKTWTGRGRKPQWINDYLAAGGDIDNLKITAAL